MHDESQPRDRFQDYLKQIHSAPGSEAVTSKFDILPAGFVIAGRYQIISFVGEGGMSMVYRAFHVQSQRYVAIKLLQKYLIADKAQIDRFHQEAEAAGRLHHQHIIKVFEGGYDNNLKCFIAMDYIEGQSLADVVRNEGPLALRRAIKIFSEACDAFDHAHKVGVIHRDIKPSNIMLTKQGGDSDFVKILDFGTAKLLPSEGVEQQYLTRTGEVFGSPLYMSPEQCMGESLDARSDIYSMGCLMYEAMTGNPPLVGGNVYETFHKQTYEMPKPLTNSRSRPWLEMTQLDMIILKCMAKRPKDRYANMMELKADLQRLTAAAGRPQTFAVKVQDRKTLADRRKKARAQTSGPPMAVIAAVIVVTLSVTGLLAFHLWQTVHLSGPIEQQIATLNARAQSAMNDGNYTDAEKNFQQALHLVQTKSDPPAQVTALYHLIDVSRVQLKDEPVIALMDDKKTVVDQYIKDTQSDLTALKANVATALKGESGDKGKGASPANGSSSLGEKKPGRSNDTNELSRLFADLNSRAESDIHMGLFGRVKETLNPIVNLDSNHRCDRASAPVLARTLHNLGMAEMGAGSYQHAYDLLLEAAKIRLGERSPDIVASAQALVPLSVKLNSYAAPKEVLNKGIASGFNDQLPALQYLLARLLLAEHKFNSDRVDAMDDVQKNVDTAANALEAGHSKETALNASVQSLQAELSFLKQDFDKAKKAYNKAIQTMQESTEDVQPVLATSLLGLANAYSESTPSDNNKALPLYMRVFAMDMHIPAKEEELNEALGKIKWTKIQSGNPMVMADLYNFKLNGDLREGNKPATAQDYVLLGRLYAQQGNNDQAIAFLEKALTVRETYFGADSWETCDVLCLLGGTYSNAGKTRIADDLLTRAKSIIAAKKQKDAKSIIPHRELISEVYRNYAEVLTKTNRDDQAKASQGELQNLLH